MKRHICIVLLLLATACASTKEAATTSTTAGGPPKAAPDAQQTLTVATPGDVYIQRNRNFLGMWPDNANICETLVGLSTTFQPVPLLATKWTLVPPNTWRFELRQGVKFQNGSPFTAVSVKFSLDRVVQLNSALNTFLGPDSVKVVNDSTVDVTPTQPNLRLPEQISHPFFDIVAAGTDPTQGPVCTGPFKYASYAPNDRLVVNRNDDYWGDKAKLRQITFRFIPDQNTRLLALQSGDVDLEWFVAAQTTASVASKPGLTVAAAPPGAVTIVSYNLHGQAPNDLLSDVALRKALSYAFDAKGLASDEWQGNAQVVSTVTPPAVLGNAATTVEPTPFDVGRASYLLDQAGWVTGPDGIRVKNGRRLTLTGIAQFDFEAEAVSYLQASVKKAGVDLQIRKADNAGQYSDVINSGRWDVDLNYFNQNDANPVRIPALLWYGKSTQTRIPFTAAGPKFDALIDQANSAPDAIQAGIKSAAAQQVLINEVAAAVPLTNFPQIYGLKTSVAGFTPHPSVNSQSWTSVYRAESK